ncbi:GMC family oxidoreductase [Kineosporia sp. R_H_3]|uniref:GMC family oxidoreductase n=1 Tax=Kineosporia sp. R_H_3 TaxID=1961848 RepID=UPI000B4BC00A|nr:GMC family oxidoreductase N-terminal domain-containing protein [Kineosporia sp. R_H_3]
MFDYVVVGAGAAGCVLAARLTQDPDVRVLLVEAGGDDRALDVRVPAAFAKLFRTARDWAVDTRPQPGLGGRRLFWPRGRMLGGSTSMNAQMWVPGERSDLDGWAAAGAVGWAWDDVAPYLDRAARTVGVRPLQETGVLTGAFLEAAAGAGADSARASDVTQQGGRRRSAADAYLRPALGRPNLEVRTGVTVRRVVVEAGRAVGVEVAGPAGPEVVRARREVLLSAGAVHSPYLLLRSGIGPATHLAASGVPVVADLPGVGEHLADHLMAITVRLTDAPVSLADAAALRNVVRYLVRRRGPLTSNVAEAYALARTRPGLTAPDVELVFAPVPYLDHGATPPPGHGYSVGAVLLTPRSTGSVRLAPGDAGAPPAVDPRYLSDPDGADLRALVAGVRLTGRVLDAPAFARFRGRPLRPAAGDAALAPDATDADVAAFVRAQAETIYHPVGTCRMGTGPDAVVGTDLRVRGVPGLRVVDASVMPGVVRGHPQAMTYAIAEKAAEALRADAVRGGRERVELRPGRR